MFKIILISIFFIQGILYAHCDGCGTDNQANAHNQNGSLTGNVKYQGKVPKAKALKKLFTTSRDPLISLEPTSYLIKLSKI